MVQKRTPPPFTIKCILFIGWKFYDFSKIIQANASHERYQKLQPTRASHESPLGPCPAISSCCCFTFISVWSWRDFNLFFSMRAWTAMRHCPQAENSQPNIQRQWQVSSPKIPVRSQSWQVPAPSSLGRRVYPAECMREVRRTNIIKRVTHRGTGGLVWFGFFSWYSFCGAKRWIFLFFCFVCFVCLFDLLSLI
jgi:hypothetical protein